MKKLIVFFAGIIFAAGSVSAQAGYIMHTIEDGETLTQLANRFGTTVGDIMRLNGMNTDSKLYVGEKVKVPVSDATPATHVVAQGETLYQISRKYHVSVSQLRDWNNIPDNTIKVGQTLYLKAPQADSQTSGVSNTATQAAEQDTVIQGEVLPPSWSATQATDQTAAAPVVTTAETYAAAYQSHANGAEVNTQGTSGIFKSSSGWSDEKYFVLMNDVTPGTMVKVQANGKTIYAKVLWNLGNVKGNEGLSYRLSDAAAAALGLSGDTFNLIVSYFKGK